MSARTKTPREGLASFHSFASVIGCCNNYAETDWLGHDAKKQEAKKKKILYTEVPVSSRLTFPPGVLSKQTVRLKQIFYRLAAQRKESNMGCFFSKKSKRKSSEKEDRTPTTTTVETTTTSNAVPLGNNTEEGPKQYSWDKREKVTMERSRDRVLKAARQ